MENSIRKICAGKIFSCIILLFCLSVITAPSVAAVSGSYVNKKTFTVSMQNRRVKDILDYIEKNSDYIFFIPQKGLTLPAR